jgi:hypothetical protein
MWLNCGKGMVHIWLSRGKNFSALSRRQRFFWRTRKSADRLQRPLPQRARGVQSLPVGRWAGAAKETECFRFFVLSC